MKAIFILIGLVAIAAVLFLATRKKGGSGVSNTEIWPFYSRNVMSAPERVLYLRLIQALPDYMILAQVQLSRFLGVKKGNNQQAWFNRINRMSADFVVCAKDSSVVAVVELDDSSHARAEAKARDAKKDKALAAAGIRIVRWNVKSIPDTASIRALLHTTVGAEARPGESISSASK